MEIEKLDRESCIALLTAARQRLAEQGLTRYPQRSDFTDAQVVAIKAFLGPWPRALEAAGLKSAREDKTAANREKRIAAKRRRRAGNQTDTRA